MSDLYCPDCDSSRVKPPDWLAPLVWVFRIFGRLPFRCLDCNKLFFLLPPPAEECLTKESHCKPELVPPGSSWLWPGILAAAHRGAAAVRSVTHRIWLFLFDIRYAPVAGAAIVGIFFAIPRRPAPLSLTLKGEGAQVKIAWNRASAIVREAQQGELQIQEDGSTTRIDLDRDLLQTGTVVYLRKARNLVVHMQVGDFGEMAAFVSASAPHAEQDEALREAEITQRKLQGQADQISRLEEMVEELEKGRNTAQESTATNISAPATPSNRSQTTAPAPLKATSSAGAILTKAKKPRANPVLKKEPIRRVPGTIIASREQPMKRPADPPPMILSAAPPQIDASASPLALSSKVIGHPVEPVPAPIPVPVSAQPRTGTLIWTGRLPRNRSLTIDGGKPSTGALTGAVPGFPVRVRVYPADLTPTGLRIYTNEQKYAADYVEAPGPRNGWNRTTYTRDPRRARGVRVVESPRRENGWKRLVLKGGASNLSVVLVEWSAIPRD